MGKKVKTLYLVLILLFMVFSMTGCAQKEKCDVCHKEKMCHYYSIDLPGYDVSKYWICQSCAEQIKTGVDILNGTIKTLK